MATGLLSQRVVKVLRDPLIGRINFSMQGAPVEGRSFVAIAGLVHSGKIAVKVHKNADADVFEYGGMRDLTGSQFIFSDDAPSELTIVHEGAHAALYYRGCFGTSELTMEAAARIAEILFALLKYGNQLRGRLNMTRTPVGLVSREALTLIDKHHLTTSSVVLPWSEYQQLRLLISAEPGYAHLPLF